LGPLFKRGGEKRKDGGVGGLRKNEISIVTEGRDGQKKKIKKKGKVGVLEEKRKLSISEGFD